MVEQSKLDNEAVCRIARRVLEAANNDVDEPSADLLTQLLNIHEKNAWMLRSLLALAQALESGWENSAAAQGLNSPSIAYAAPGCTSRARVMTALRLRVSRVTTRQGSSRAMPSQRASLALGRAASMA